MRHLRTLIAAALLFLLQAGCGGAAFDYQPANETKPGPGLFSGEDGVFRVVGRPQELREEKVEASPVQ